MSGIEIRLPGETEQQGLQRRVTMHEFLMTGGVQIGEREGKMRYSDPITVATDPVCPWHGDDCQAWTEIVEGRGYWTAMEAELAALQNVIHETTGFIPEPITTRADELIDKLSLRPRDALALRERSTDEIAAERAEHKRKTVKARAEFAAAVVTAQKVAEGKTHAPNWQVTTASGRTSVYCEAHKDDAYPLPGDVWTRVPKGRSQCQECAFDEAAPKRTIEPWEVDEATGEVFDRPMWEHKPFVPDTRDVAFDAFAGSEVPDTIEIDGDEGEEEGDE